MTLKSFVQTLLLEIFSFVMFFLTKIITRNSRTITNIIVVKKIIISTNKKINIPLFTAAPNISLYQFDETSGYYYDPATGLYYDAHSQYYYNNETGSYMYWNPERCTYTLAPASRQESEPSQAEISAEAKPEHGRSEDKKDKRENKHDKVKVAKKIVKDMEKWAKQLNQKKDMPFIAPAAPSPPIAKQPEEVAPTSFRPPNSGYADVGFAILEKKDKTGTLNDLLTPSAGISKLVSSYGGSDSDEHEDNFANKQQQQRSEPNERDYVDLDKLTCLLCKRAFQSHEILSKHLKMSNLHKDNLQKYKLTKGFLDSDSSAAASR